VSLLFQPRQLPADSAEAVVAYRDITASSELDCAASGDVVADVERLSRALARERFALDAALTEVELSVETVIGSAAACAEWIGTAVRAPTGVRVTVRGVTVVDLDGDRITAVRHYWDELARLADTSRLPEPGPPIS